jgi:hypothetical protein
MFSFRYILDIDTFYHSLARFWELSLGGLLFAIASKYSYEISKTNIILSNKILVFFGLISFPLYLWHYVLISYMHIFGLDVVKYGILIILLSILLSYLTYRYIEIYARKQTSYSFATILFVCLLVIGFIGQYTYKHKGLPDRPNLVSNDIFKKQFIRTPATDKTGMSLITKILGDKPTNNYIRATSEDFSKKFIAIIGDSHAHTSYPGFAKFDKEKGYESLLIANSSCPPYIGGAMGKNIKDIQQCQQKIDNIYDVLNSKLNICKIIFVTRMGYMYDAGFGIEAANGKKWNYHYKDYFLGKKHYNQKEQFLQKIENLFKKFNKTKKEFYFLLEDPELGFSPKNCMIRPFDVFQSKCRIKLKDFLKRQKEYRDFVYETAKKYSNINILDPKDFYCDSKYCYALRHGKMLYADDDHHSIDGSILQTKYFENRVFNDK